MIGRRKHPREEARQVFVPLRRGDGVHWVPVRPLEHHESLWEAAEICAGDHADRMAEIARKARVVRAISEHPELEFAFESVDADMLRDEIRALEEMIRTENENAAHLLDAPDREHVIYDGGARLGVNADGLMVPWSPPDPPRVPEDETHGDEPWQTPDELFAHFLDAGLRAVEQQTGEIVSPAGIKDAIARLRDVHGNGGDGDGDDDGGDDDGEEEIS